MNEILIGIIGSLAATIIAVSSVYIWNNLIIPYFQKKYYSGVIVEGIWKGKVELDYVDENLINDQSILAREYKLELKQNGNVISGEFQIINKTKNQEFTRESNYLINGVIYNSFLLLNYRSKTKSSGALGSLLLRIHLDGLVMDGSGLFTAIEILRVDHVGEIKLLKKLN
jgi:hypothetical protein